MQQLRFILKLKVGIMILVAVLVTSCGKIKPDGTITSKDVQTEPFKEIKLGGKYRVFLVSGPSNMVTIESYENIADNLQIKVSGNILEINEKRETAGVDFYNLTIYTKFYPEKISIKDSVEMTVSGSITTDHLQLNLKNNATLIGAVSSRKADLEMFDTSRANLTGFTKNAVLKIADTANFIAPYWKLENLFIDSKNANYAEVNVKDSIKGQILNTAKFLYYNEPIRAFKIDKTAMVKNKMLD